MFRSKLTDAIVKIFSEGDDMYENHRKIIPLLHEMAADKNILFDIIRYNLGQPDFFKNTRTYSTFTLNILETNDITFVVNIFPALPDRKTNVSFQSVHHHGNLLLSTVAAFGPGYKAITFKKGFEIDKTTGTTKMSLEKIYQNTLHNFDFIDVQTPHIVFYPESISATYALWSKDTKKVTGNALKKIPVVTKFKKQLRTIIKTFRLQKLAGITNVEYYDFYPDNGKLIAMKERIHYNSTEGTNQNFIQNIFHFVQQTRFDDLEFLKTLSAKSSTPPFAKQCIEDILAGKKIEDEFIDAFLNVPKVNLLFEEIIAATTDKI
jgi:hypothetical protein